MARKKVLASTEFSILVELFYHISVLCLVSLPNESMVGFFNCKKDQISNIALLSENREFGLTQYLQSKFG